MKKLSARKFHGVPSLECRTPYIGIIREHQMTSVELLRDAQAEDRTLHGADGMLPLCIATNLSIDATLWVIFDRIGLGLNARSGLLCLQ
jgi:hypothetical protein